MEILASTDIRYICADICMIANPIFYYIASYVYVCNALLKFILHVYFTGW